MVIVPDPMRVITGAIVSMLDTVAVVDPVFPDASTKVKVNDPFVVKVWIIFPLAVVVTPVELVMVMVSEAPVRVAVTDWFVTVGYVVFVPVFVLVLVYTTLAVGGVWSVTMMVLVTGVATFPAASVLVNVRV